jgi:hypothetical protein
MLLLGRWEILWWEGICVLFAGPARKKHHMDSHTKEIPKERPWEKTMGRSWA